MNGDPGQTPSNCPGDAWSGNPRGSGSFWLRLVQAVRRSTDHQAADPDPAPVAMQLIPVWDVTLTAYRPVDLSNRSDPLWSAANELAALRRYGASRDGPDARAA